MSKIEHQKREKDMSIHNILDVEIQRVDSWIENKYNTYNISD